MLGILKINLVIKSMQNSSETVNLNVAHVNTIGVLRTLNWWKVDFYNENWSKSRMKDFCSPIAR